MHPQSVVVVALAGAGTGDHQTRRAHHRDDYYSCCCWMWRRVMMETASVVVAYQTNHEWSSCPSTYFSSNVLALVVLVVVGSECAFGHPLCPSFVNIYGVGPRHTPSVLPARHPTVCLSAIDEEWSVESSPPRMELH